MAEASELVYKTVPDGLYKNLISQFGGVDLDNGGWISGGSVRKVWFDLPWAEQDVDYFFNSRQGFVGFVKGISDRYENRQTSMPFDIDAPVKKSTYMTCYSTDNANTYTFEQFNLADQAVTDSADTELRIKLQTIKKYFPASLRELFSSFDFTVCQFATDGKMMVATRSAVDDCESGRLVMVPESPRKLNVVRMAKYCAYGFSPTDDMMETAINSLANNEALEMVDDY